MKLISGLCAMFFAVQCLRGEVRDFVSPDGEVRVSLDGRVFSVTTIGNHGALRSFLGSFFTPIDQVVWRPDSQAFILFSGNTYRLWSIAQKAEDFVIFERESSYDKDRITVCSYSPDGHFLMFGFASGDVHIYDLRAFWKEYKYRHSQPVEMALWRPDSQGLLSCGKNTFRLWDSTCNVSDLSGCLIFEAETSCGSDSSMSVCSFSPDGRMVALGFENGYVQIYDRFSPQKREEYYFNEHFDGAITRFEWPSSNRLVTFKQVEEREEPCGEVMFYGQGSSMLNVLARTVEPERPAGGCRCLLL